jgi:hypothetical protein
MTCGSKGSYTMSSGKRERGESLRQSHTKARLCDGHVSDLAHSVSYWSAAICSNGLGRRLRSRLGRGQADLADLLGFRPSQPDSTKVDPRLQIRSVFGGMAHDAEIVAPGRDQDAPPVAPVSRACQSSPRLALASDLAAWMDDPRRPGSRALLHRRAGRWRRSRAALVLRLVLPVRTASGRRRASFRDKMERD